MKKQTKEIFNDGKSKISKLSTGFMCINEKGESREFTLIGSCMWWLGIRLDYLNKHLVK